MKNLLLIRHAKSSRDESNLHDWERPLNDRGLTDAPVMGKRLHDRGIAADLFLASPANRARQTAQIIARETGYPVDAIKICNEIYLDGVESIFRLITNQPESCHTLFLCGHNPDISMLATQFVPGFVSSIPTCGIIHISFNINSWKQVKPAGGKLVLFDFPKK
ncbi:MAG TPA: histidine phosphatase family protein [bacterium]|nr:histidine phosphatase family protein [bacterium]HPN43159.1 histidine phosphatase family protein [bacterium]